MISVLVISHVAMLLRLAQSSIKTLHKIGFGIIKGYSINMFSLISPIDVLPIPSDCRTEC